MFSIRLSEEEANMRYSVSVFLCVCDASKSEESSRQTLFFQGRDKERKKKLGRKERTNKRGNVRKNQRRQ